MYTWLEPLTRSHPCYTCPTIHIHNMFCVISAETQSSCTHNLLKHTVHHYKTCRENMSDKCFNSKSIMQPKTAAESHPIWASFWEQALLGHVVQPWPASVTVTADITSRQEASTLIVELAVLHGEIHSISCETQWQWNVIDCIMK